MTAIHSMEGGNRWKLGKGAVSVSRKMEHTPVNKIRGTKKKREKSKSNNLLRRRGDGDGVFAKLTREQKRKKKRGVGERGTPAHSQLLGLLETEGRKSLNGRIAGSRMNTREREGKSNGGDITKERGESGPQRSVRVRGWKGEYFCWGSESALGGDLATVRKKEQDEKFSKGYGSETQHGKEGKRNLGITTTIRRKLASKGGQGEAKEVISR